MTLLRRGGRAAGLLCLAALLSACAAGPVPDPREAAPFRIASGDPEAPRNVVFLVPGALSSTRIFGRARDWGDDETLVMEYRLPGLDERPRGDGVSIDGAARAIALRAAQSGAERIVILGFSTGGAIGIEAAGRLPGRDVTVVGFSSAVPFPGLVGGGISSGLDILGATIRSHSLDTDMVLEAYYKTLLFGRHWDRAPGTRARAQALLALYRQLGEPSRQGLARAHFADVAGWTLSRAARTRQARYIFFHGAEDPVISVGQVRGLARQLGGELRVIDTAGHLLLTVRPDLIDAIHEEVLGLSKAD